MAWIAPVVAAGVQLYGSMSGQKEAQAARDAATGAHNSYLTQLAGLQLPDIEKMKLALASYQTAGQLTPEQEAVQQLQANDAMQNIALDPRLKNAQMQQLESLQKLGETGISPEEQAQLNNLRRQTESENQARMKSLLEQQQTRGVASGEGALAARLLGTQSAANTQAEGSDQLAAMAFRRALEAKSGAAGVAGNMESQDYARQAELARALNQRELQNVAMKAGTQQRNVDRFNQAQASNLSNQQRIMDANVGLSNDQQARNKALLQQDFNNRLTKITGQAAPTSEYVKSTNLSANDIAKGGQNMGAGAAESIIGLAGLFGKDTKSDVVKPPVSGYKDPYSIA